MNSIINWFTALADFIVFNVLGMPEGLWYTEATHYFITGFTQLSLLLLLVVYVMSSITNYLSFARIGAYLENHKQSGWGNLLAALFGAVTPFCSCSSIPLFIGMMQSRVPLGIALSFLITSPLVNEIAIVVFWVSYGWKVTLLYIFSGLVLGIAGGMLLEKLGLARYVADWIQNLAYQKTEISKDNTGFLQRISAIHKEASTTVIKLIPYVGLGMLVGAFIHGYVPESFFEQYVSGDNPLAVPIAVMLAIPLYIDAVSILPVIESLVGKGVPLGTAIAFMMGAIGLSIPEALLLKKVMKKELILSFFVTIGAGMILSGYIFNFIF